MAGEWAPIRLGDVCMKIGSGATPRGGSEVYLEAGPYSLIRSQNIYNNGFHQDGLAFIGEQHATELENVAVQKSDVLLNITGDSVARVCQVNPKVLPARVNQHVAIIRPDPAKLDPRFLRYVLVSPEMQTKLLSWAGSGGTRNALTKGMIESLEVHAPINVIEQRAIAEILGSLDDKIEANRRMNETLEAMASAIFKSWFVDFDPVRAKMEGRWRKGQPMPGLPSDMWDIFPRGFADSEIGGIPKGWSTVPSSETVEISGGGTPKTSVPDFWGGNILWYAIGDTPGAGDVFVIDTAKRITKKGLENCAAQVLPVGATIISARGTVGNLALVGTPMAMNQSCYALRGSQGFGDYYTYFATKDMIADLKQRTHGSVFDTITRDTFKTVHVISPPRELVSAFEDAVRPSMRQILLNLRQCQALASTRDLLLPKLLSGKLRVGQAETVA